MRRWIGRSVIAVGLIHTVFGVWGFRGMLTTWWAEGLVGTVDGQADREFAFWFLAFGLMAILFGGQVDAAEARGSAMPPLVAWGFLAMIIIFLVIMPKSGGWLLLPPALGGVWSSRWSSG